MDLLLEDRVVVELKAVERLVPIQHCPALDLSQIDRVAGWILVEL